MGNHSSSVPSGKNPKSSTSDVMKNYNNTETDRRGFLCSEKITSIKSALQEGRIEETLSIINKILKDVNDTCLSIAVTGESGAGKSSFINAFRGIDNDDAKAAKVGPVETTMEIISYENPHYPNIKLWDLPGIGTPNFKPETYLEDVKFSSYDFFIIVSSSRFRKNDAELAKEIKRMGKNFYFVRSKVDSDLENERKAKPKSFQEKNVLENIEQNSIEQLQKAGIEKPRVFLISSFNLASYDFPKLHQILEKDLPEIKRQLFYLSLPNISDDVIDQKAAIHRDQIWLKALNSGAWATIPLVGIIREDAISKLLKHLSDYRKEFGVDDESLLKIAQASNTSVEKVKGLIQSPHLLKLEKNESISDKFLRYSEVFFATSGGLVATGLYYRKSYYTHLYLLETVVSDAKILLRKLWENSEDHCNNTGIDKQVGLGH